MSLGLWSKLSPILQSNRIHDKRELRLTFKGILYRLRNGNIWPDLPREFGNRNKVYKRFNDLSGTGKLTFILKTLSENADTELKFVDGSVVKAHSSEMLVQFGDRDPIDWNL